MAVQPSAVGRPRSRDVTRAALEAGGPTTRRHAPFARRRHVKKRRRSKQPPTSSFAFPSLAFIISSVAPEFQERSWCLRRRWPFWPRFRHLRDFFSRPSTPLISCAVLQMLKPGFRTPSARGIASLERDLISRLPT